MTRADPALPNFGDWSHALQHARTVWSRSGGRAPRHRRFADDEGGDPSGESSQSPRDSNFTELPAASALQVALQLLKRCRLPVPAVNAEQRLQTSSGARLPEAGRVHFLQAVRREPPHPGNPQVYRGQSRRLVSCLSSLLDCTLCFVLGHLQGRYGRPAVTAHSLPPPSLALERSARMCCAASRRLRHNAALRFVLVGWSSAPFYALHAA